MPRRQMLTVRRRPKLRSNRWYKARVQKACINQEAATLEVTCTHMEKPQTGRRHKFHFDLPLYPQSPASEFLAACGLDTGHAGNRVCVDDTTDVIVKMKFSAPDFDETAVTFARIARPSHHTGQCSEAEHRPSIDQYDETFEGKDPL